MVSTVFPNLFSAALPRLYRRGSRCRSKGISNHCACTCRFQPFTWEGLRFATLITDITERKRAEESAERESEATSRLWGTLRFTDQMGVWNLVNLVENKCLFSR